MALARAFLKNPKILVLDEATSALDTVTERAIHTHLRAEAEDLERERESQEEGQPGGEGGGGGRGGRGGGGGSRRRVGVTQVVVAHRLSTIMDADRIVVLQHGQVVECGPHDRLVQIPGGVYRHMWELAQKKQDGDGDGEGEGEGEASQGVGSRAGVVVGVGGER